MTCGQHLSQQAHVMLVTARFADADLAVKKGRDGWQETYISIAFCGPIEDRPAGLDPASLRRGLVHGCTWLQTTQPLSIEDPARGSLVEPPGMGCCMVVLLVAVLIGTASILKKALLLQARNIPGCSCT